MAKPADESENRSPINFAKLGERCARLLLVATRIRAGKNHAPPGRHKPIRSLDAAWGAVWFQRRSASMVRSYETSLKTSCLLRPVARALKGARSEIFTRPTDASASSSRSTHRGLRGFPQSPRVGGLSYRRVLCFSPPSPETVGRSSQKKVKIFSNPPISAMGAVGDALMASMQFFSDSWARRVGFPEVVFPSIASWSQADVIRPFYLVS